MFFVGVGAACVVVSRTSRAEDIPAALQVDLITRLADYDKNMKARAGDRAVVLVVTKPGDGDSERAAAQLMSAFGRVERIAGLPHQVSTFAYGGAQALVDAAKAKKAAIVYLTGALGSEVEAVQKAFENVNVLTMAPSADMVRRGAVLGFELVSSRPKLFINLPQAAKQSVAMSAEVLKLMTVFR